MDQPIIMTMEGLGPWSHSKLKVLKKCPLNFYLKYIKKIKVAEEVKAPETLIGSAAHRILEFYVQGETLEESFKKSRVEFLESIPQSLWEEKVETMELSMINFKTRFDDFNKKQGVKRIFTELRLGITKDFTPTTFFGKDVFFRGIIDLTVLLECQDVIFWDHKKGGSATYGLKNHNDQLNTYKVLFHYGVEKINGASAGINFIEEGTMRLGEYHPREEIEGKLKNDLLFSIDTGIHQVQELKYFKHIAGSQCTYCDFKEDCKAGKLKELELGTKELLCSKP